MKSFCILDDESDMNPYMDKLVQTTWKTGMTMEHAEEIIKMLTK